MIRMEDHYLATKEEVMEFVRTLPPKTVEQIVVNLMEGIPLFYRGLPVRLKKMVQSKHGHRPPEGRLL